MLMGATEPMNIFLGQEIDRIQKVIELVKSTLEDLLLAINGIIIMNEVINDCVNTYILFIYFNLILICLFINFIIEIIYRKVMNLL
jgi:hypothetical protein